MRTRWLRFATWVVLATGLLGCRALMPTTPDCPGDPDKEIVELRNAWVRAPYHGLYEGRPACAASCAECQTAVKSKEFIRRQTENLLYRYPRHVPTLMFSALLAYEAGEPVEAAGHLDTLLSIQPQHPEAAVLRARIALEDGNVPYARNLLEEQVALRPDHSELHETLASAYFMSDDHERALQAVQAAERLGAPKWRTAYNRALIEEATGQTDEAIKHYKESRAYNPGWAPATERLEGLQKGLPGGTQTMAFPPPDER